jgi:pimeloyl-ACP methyl ester carboxylesterase
MAKKYGSSNCRAYHTNTPAPSEPKADTNPQLYEKYIKTPLTDDEKRNLQRAGHVLQQGYYRQQCTKPLTLGYGLRDSPVGLLAWIYEKLVSWSDNYSWTDEEILTWVSIYWFSTAGPDASVKVYYTMEHSQPNAFAAAQAYIDVPLGISRFSNDVLLLPKLWNHNMGPIVFEGEYEKGGHFAAWEQPDAIVKDLRTMFRDGTAFGFAK